MLVLGCMVYISSQRRCDTLDWLQTEVHWYAANGSEASMCYYRSLHLSFRSSVSASHAFDSNFLI